MSICAETGKVSYGSESRAAGDASVIGIYYCHDCRSWHRTSRRGGDAQQRAIDVRKRGKDEARRTLTNRKFAPLGSRLPATTLSTLESCPLGCGRLLAGDRLYAEWFAPCRWWVLYHVRQHSIESFEAAEPDMRLTFSYCACADVPLPANVVVLDTGSQEGEMSEHCPTCGLSFADDNDTTHECPPGFLHTDELGSSPKNSPDSDSGEG